MRRLWWLGGILLAASLVGITPASAASAAPPGCGSSDFYFQATNGAQDFMINNGGNQPVTLQFVTNQCFHLLTTNQPGWYEIENNSSQCLNVAPVSEVVVPSSCRSGDSVETWGSFDHQWENEHYGGIGGGIDAWMTSTGNAGSGVSLFSGSGWATPRA